MFYLILYHQLFSDHILPSFFCRYWSQIAIQSLNFIVYFRSYNPVKNLSMVSCKWYKIVYNNIFHVSEWIYCHLNTEIMINLCKIFRLEKVGSFLLLHLYSKKEKFVLYISRGKEYIGKIVKYINWWKMLFLSRFMVINISLCIFRVHLCAS